MLVKDRMTKEVVCLLRTDGVQDVHALMAEIHVRHLPVVENGRLVGLVSDRDVLLHAVKDGETLVFPDNLTAEHLMTKVLVTCGGDTTIGEVAAKMIDLKIDCVPVTDLTNKLIGLITSTDLLAIFRDAESERMAEPIPFDFRLRYNADVPESLI